jgi:transcriptional regulator with XRE-family HTH domain
MISTIGRCRPDIGHHRAYCRAAYLSRRAAPQTFVQRSDGKMQPLENCNQVVRNFLKAAVAEIATAETQWLRKICHRAGLNQGKLADRIGVDVRTVERWLKNEQKISDENLERLQIFFGHYLAGLGWEHEEIKRQVDYTTCIPTQEARVIVGYLAALGLPRGDRSLEIFHCLDLIFTNPTWADAFRRVGKAIDVNVILGPVAVHLKKPPRYYNSYEKICGLIAEWGKTWIRVMNCLYEAGLRNSSE